MIWRASCDLERQFALLCGRVVFVDADCHAEAVSLAIEVFQTLEPVAWIHNLTVKESTAEARAAHERRMGACARWQQNVANGIANSRAVIP